MSFLRAGLVCLVVAQMNPMGLAQSGIITTYAGPALPADGSLAVSQAIDTPSSVAPDGAAGFYVASWSQDRVYRVTADGRIKLVAGNGTHGFSGDGGAATSAQLSYPGSIAVDAAGNLFVPDSMNNRVRKVTPGGVISTVAGNGTEGFSGDGSSATAAQLKDPRGVAVDTAGNFYIADTLNCRVRKVTPGGVISTVAGNGTCGFGGDGGPATSATLSYTRWIVVDTAGNLFITDAENHRVRKVAPGGVISTVAGNGTYGFSGDGGPATSAGLSYPEGIAVDTTGNLFISDAGHYRVRKVTPGGVINTVAGGGANELGDGGPATSAQLSDSLLGVGADAAGNLFIADSGNNRVRRVTPDGVIGTVAGNGTWGFSGDNGRATSAQLCYPRGIAMDRAGNLFIADSGNNRVREVTPGGVISTVAGNGKYGFGGDGGAATAAQLFSPQGVALDTTGNLFISDYYNNRVRKVTPGGVISTVAGNGKYGFGGDGGQATSAMFSGPNGVAVDAAGNLFVADTMNNRVRKVTPGGVISTVAGGGANGLGDGGQATSAQLDHPTGIGLDTAGNLFIADYYKHRVRKVTPGGVISTVAGNGTYGFGGDGGPATSARLEFPSGVAVDQAGNLFIADHDNNRIRKVTPGGTISTAAGNGKPGFSGDGNPAASATFNDPSGGAIDPTGNLFIAVDTAGDLFISDTDNHRVRRIARGLSSATDLTLNSGGIATSSTAGLNERVQTGYATGGINAGVPPYGTAVFSYKQNGMTVSEASVPAAPPTTAARLFIDYRSSVAAIPGRISAGTINVNTGIAVVNNGSASAIITYTLRSTAGATLSSGHGMLAAGAHFAKFIDQLHDMAPDFVLPPDFQTSSQFASLEITSTQPLSILALRMTTNQRDEALFTTTPIADVTKPAPGGAIFFPQFADGGGYTTSLVLLNTSNGMETGTLQIIDDNGSPLIVNQVGGSAGSIFRYSIPPGGVARFQTDGFPASTKAGWAELTPDVGTSTPIGAGVFSYNPGDFLVTESGIPAVVSTTHARVYVDLSGGHNTGLAIANPASTATTVTVTAFQSDGVTGMGTSRGPLQLPANGHSARFASELVAGLPTGFTGVLDIISSAPFAALTMRSLNNERNDFLLATFPVADMTLAAPSPIIFPQIADGGGYTTQFILIGASGASSVTLGFYGEDGKPLLVGK